MGKPDFGEENNPALWLILGYLRAHPDAKDTAEGVQKWWLRSQGVDANMVAVRGALNSLAARGWLNVIGSASGHRIYGLNQARKNILEQFLQGTVLCDCRP